MKQFLFKFIFDVTIFLHCYLQTQDRSEESQNTDVLEPSFNAQQKQNQVTTICEGIFFLQKLPDRWLESNLNNSQVTMVT